MSKKKACTLTLALGIPYFFCVGLIAGHDSMGGFPVMRALLFAITASAMSTAGVFVLMCHSDSLA